MRNDPLTLKTKWAPKPLTRPEVDKSLCHLHPLTRSAEAIRFSILTIEFWLSPEGQVREWLRHNGRLAIILAIPTFTLLPITTFALWQLSGWLSALLTIAKKLIVLPILLLIAFVIIVVACRLFRLVQPKK